MEGTGGAVQELHLLPGLPGLLLEGVVLRQQLLRLLLVTPNLPGIKIIRLFIKENLSCSLHLFPDPPVDV